MDFNRYVTILEKQGFENVKKCKKSLKMAEMVMLIYDLFQ